MDSLAGAAPCRKDIGRVHMVSSSGLEIRCRGQGQKLAWLYPDHQGIQEGNLGLANPILPLVGVWAGEKATPGVTAPSRARAPIDPAVCDIDVVSLHPGGAEAAKGGGAHPLKEIVRWV